MRRPALYYSIVVHGYIGQAIKQPHADPIVNDFGERDIIEVGEYDQFDLMMLQ